MIYRKVCTLVSQTYSHPVIRLRMSVGECVHCDWNLHCSNLKIWTNNENKTNCLDFSFLYRGKYGTSGCFIPRPGPASIKFNGIFNTRNIAYFKTVLIRTRDIVNWVFSLQWRHNGCDGVSNKQRIDFLLSCLFMHRSKKTSKLRVTGLCEGNSPGPVKSPHKSPVTRKIYPFDDIIL